MIDNPAADEKRIPDGTEGEYEGDEGAAFDAVGEVALSIAHEIVNETARSAVHKAVNKAARNAVNETVKKPPSTLCTTS